MTSIARSGSQYLIQADGYRASVASIGASLRTLRLGTRELIVPFEPDEVRPAFRGATLGPWPNRIVNGRYSFQGQAHQLSLTEPDRGHALHGLLAWIDFSVVEQNRDHVTLEAEIPPQQGYPFRVLVRTTYALGPAGLTQTVVATSLDSVPLPWGTGPHPYLRAGEGRVDDWRLTIPADDVLLTTPDRLIPTRVEPVDLHPHLDFRRARLIESTFIDHAFTTLDRTDGLASVTLEAADGRGVGMVWDAKCKWVQVHTADTELSTTHRVGLAVEPMTCPPDAFNSGTDLIILGPNQSHSASWRIFAI